MTEFDKKVKELARNVEVPREYNQKVDDVLRSLPEQEPSASSHKKWRGRAGMGVLLCLVGIVCLLRFGGIEASANFFEAFRITIMDLLHVGGEEEQEKLQVESREERIESKQDLMLELQETLIDSQGIYVLVQVTAPPDITLNKDITFDYFAFCEGENYNADKLIGGATDCYLIETMEEKPNVAVYVMNLSADMEAYEGREITACFKDLTVNPNGENPELLVEGMWSITFSADMTVRESIEVEGTPDMEFSYITTTAWLKQIRITPLGMTILSDVSNMPYEDLGISDTTILVRLKMIDGSELYIRSDNPDEAWIVDSGSSEFNEENGTFLQKDIYTFKEVLDISKVIGIYVQDIYVPVAP